MLSKYNPLEVELLLKRAEPTWPPFPRASDRPAWEKIKSRVGEAETQRQIREGEEAAKQPIPFISATLFLESKRTGEDDRYENTRYHRSGLLCSVAIAECLEGKGRFHDSILDLAWAICEESAWGLPCHLTELPDIHDPSIDIGAATIALQMAELYTLFGDLLDPYSHLLSQGVSCQRAMSMTQSSVMPGTGSPRGAGGRV